MLLHELHFLRMGLAQSLLFNLSIVDLPLHLLDFLVQDFDVVLQLRLVLVDPCDVEFFFHFSQLHFFFQQFRIIPKVLLPLELLQWRRLLFINSIILLQTPGLSWWLCTLASNFKNQLLHSIVVGFHVHNLDPIVGNLFFDDPHVGLLVEVVNCRALEVHSLLQ